MQIVERLDDGFPRNPIFGERGEVFAGLRGVPNRTIAAG